VPAGMMSEALVGRLKEVLAEHPGDVPVFVHLTGDRDTVVRLGADHRVEVRTALYAGLREILGPDAVLS